MRTIILVTGLSGSGKTTALRALEDAGFFCMDNLPIPLLPKVLELAVGQEPMSQLAVGVDAREQKFLDDAGAVLDDLADQGQSLQVLFIDADEDTLLGRFRETRRRHPIDTGGDVRAAIRTERKLLADLRARSDRIIDTSAMTVHELKDLVQSEFADASARKLRIKVTSFGFRRGVPSESDLVFDVRFIRNPNYVPELREHNGLEPKVAGYVLQQDDVQQFLSHLDGLLSFLLPRYLAEGKVYLTIGIGCTGGKHRSVAISEELGRRLVATGSDAIVEHRDQAHW